jgi:LytS/YehU family sensor histidine kinase
LSCLNTQQIEFIYFIPVIGLAVFNGIISLICFYQRDKSRALAFMLSSLLILIIGGSSCVTIKLKKKQRKKPATSIQARLV